MRVAIQGEAGSFHHLAARRWYGEDFEIVPCQTFADVFQAVAGGQADQAVVAIENSLYGSINSVYDLLTKHELPIIGEISERIHQHLVTLPDAELAKITSVISHPVALEQCSDWIDKQLPGAERVEYYDTAAAVELIKKRGDKSAAAIASQLAAELSDLPILESKIENDRQNYTRFVVLAPSGQPPDNANKSSLVLQTSHKPGALYSALGVFAGAGVNLTKLQSRPVPGKVWRYLFYVDAEVAGESLRRVIKQLEKQDCKVTILGEYQAAASEYED